MMTNHGVGKLTGCGLNGNAAMVPSNLHGGVSNQAVRDDNDMPRLLQADVFNNCMESAHNALNELSCQIEVFAQNSSFVMRPAEPGRRRSQRVCRVSIRQRCLRFRSWWCVCRRLRKLSWRIGGDCSRCRGGAK